MGQAANMTPDNSEILWAISTAAYLLPGLVGIYRRRFLGRDLQLLLLYVLLTIAANFLVTLFEFHHELVKWVEFTWPPLQYGLLVGTFLFWTAQRSVRVLLGGSIVLLSLFVLAGLVADVNVGLIRSLSGFIAAMLLVPVSAYTLVVAHAESRLSSGQQPAIWVASGALIYFGGVTILFVFGHPVTQALPPMIHLLGMPIRSSLNIIFSGLLTVAFLNAQPKKLSE